MKIDSRVVVTVLAIKFLRSANNLSFLHVRRYSKRELFGCVEQSGLKVIKIRYWNSILFPLGLLMRPLDSDNLEMRVPPNFVNSFLSKLEILESNNRLFGIFPQVSLVIGPEKQDV